MVTVMWRYNLATTTLDDNSSTTTTGMTTMTMARGRGWDSGILGRQGCIFLNYTNALPCSYIHILIAKKCISM